MIDMPINKNMKPFHLIGFQYNKNGYIASYSDNGELLSERFREYK